MYHPQANEHVKVNNMSIMMILKRKVGNNLRTWVNLILDTLWENKTTIKTMLGHMPGLQIRHHSACKTDMADSKDREL